MDDVPREITAFQGEDAPVTAGIVIDNSASMAPKRDEVLAAALAFARASNPKDQMFVVHFNDHARLGLPPDIPFTGNVAELETAVAGFDLGGTTAFYDALLLAEVAVSACSCIRERSFSPLRTAATIQVTPRWRRRWVARSVRVSSFIPSGSSTKTIGIGILRCCRRLPRTPGAKRSSLNRLPTSLRSVSRTAGEIRQQYVLSFNSGVEDGAWHRIRLTASDPKYGALQVQTRPATSPAKPTESANRLAPR